MTFSLNGKLYKTDKETLKVLSSIMPSAKASDDSSAVIAMMTLGLSAGVIKEINQEIE